NLKRLTRLLVDVGGTKNAVLILHRRQRNRPCNLCSGTLCRLNDLSSGGVEHTVVISLQANPDSLSCHRLLSFLYAKNLFESPPAEAGGADAYLMISEMVPAPTVRPPSRIAKRRPFSMATGVCSVISSAMLSPGITISVPSGSFAEPVTSVVRK